MMEPELGTTEQHSNGHDKESEVATEDPFLMTLRQDQPICWILMPQTLERIKNFCLRYDTDSDPKKLAESVQVSFASGNNGVLIMVAVEQYRVVGHLLATMDSWFDKKFITILQYEIDSDSGIDTGFLQAGFNRIKKWGKEQGAQAIHINARYDKDQELFNQSLVRMFETFYGFEPHKILMRGEL